MRVYDWGATLLGALLDRDPTLSIDPEADRRAWRQSGAMALTGRTDGPALPAPRRLVPGVEWLARATDLAGHVDALALLAERAACAGFVRAGHVSCSGGTWLVDAADGPLALTLARPTDVALLPALLGTDALGANPWLAVARVFPNRPAAHWVELGALLGLAIAGLGEVGRPTVEQPAVQARIVGPCPDGRLLDEPVRVLDLSSLWAGPLCAHVLQFHGAQVRKAESEERPDGARMGPALFFDLLHAGQESVPLDLRSAVGRAALAALVAKSDIVIEASRPRALEQAGFDVDQLIRSGRTQAWIAITGYGQNGPGRNRSAFGDDAAVAGGLVAHDLSGPVFLADAIADPLTGLTAAAAALAALRSNHQWYVDISMARVAAAFADTTESTASDVIDDADVAPALPRHRSWRGSAPALANVVSQ